MKNLNKESSKQIQQMSDTITNFKNFFKPEKNRTKFDISSVINHSISMIKPILEAEHIDFKIDIKENIQLIGYPLELGQSIINIVTNAKDALVENSIKEKLIQIEVVSNKKTTKITIKDNAGGIPKNVVDKVFDPYFSTKHKLHGTGLGLYMAKIIIEDHANGNLSVINDTDGAVFTIALNAG